MRVAIVAAAMFGRGKGGAEKVAASVANLIVNAGGGATMITQPGKGEPSYPLLSNVRIVTVKELRYPSSDSELRSLHGQFDLLIGFGMSGFYARIPEIAQALDAPYAIQECTNPRRMIQTLYIEEDYPTVQHAIAVREEILRKAVAVRFTVPEYKRTVPSDIKPKVYAFYNSLSHIADEIAPPSKKIIMVGAMKNANKNGMAAVEAFASFDRPDWQLHLYGQNKFVAHARRYSRVVDHGVVNSPDEIYKDAAMLVIPSYDEGLPNVVVEAFSYGVPCIGFYDCPGVNHLIRNGENGLLVARSVRGALTNAMHQLADPETRSRFARNALQFARNHFQQRDFEANWMRLIQYALSRKKAAA